MIQHPSNSLAADVQHINAVHITRLAAHDLGRGTLVAVFIRHRSERTAQVVEAPRLDRGTHAQVEEVTRHVVRVELRATFGTEQQPGTLGQGGDRLRPQGDQPFDARLLPHLVDAAAPHVRRGQLRELVGAQRGVQAEQDDRTHLVAAVPEQPADLLVGVRPHPLRGPLPATLGLRGRGERLPRPAALDPLSPAPGDEAAEHDDVHRSAGGAEVAHPLFDRRRVGAVQGSNRPLVTDGAHEQQHRVVVAADGLGVEPLAFLVTDERAGGLANRYAAAADGARGEGGEVRFKVGVGLGASGADRSGHDPAGLLTHAAIPATPAPRQTVFWAPECHADSTGRNANRYAGASNRRLSYGCGMACQTNTPRTASRWGNTQNQAAGGHLSSQRSKSYGRAGTSRPARLAVGVAAISIQIPRIHFDRRNANRCANQSAYEGGGL